MQTLFYINNKTKLFGKMLKHFVRNFILTVAYLDIKAAFDSVDRMALWKALRNTCVPEVLLYILLWPFIRTLVLMSASVKSPQADSAHPPASGKVAL